MPTTPFQRLILRAVLRDVYPMVIRLVGVPDCQSLDRRLEQSGPLAPERFSLREVNERVNQRLKARRFA